MPIASSQIPFFNTNQIQKEKNLIDIFNRPYPCGNFVCSQVWFYGFPLKEIASYPINQQNSESVLPVEERAARIQNNLKKILQLTLANNSNDSISTVPISNVENNIFQLNKSKKQTIKPENKNSDNSFEIYGISQKIQKNIHPKTPKIKVGTFNGETVIYFPKQFGAPQNIIATITKPDALHYDKTIEYLAQEGRNIIRSIISFALHEHDFDARHRFFKPILMIALILVMILLSFGLLWVQRRCQSYYRKIRHQLQHLENSLSLDPEFAKLEDLETKESQLNLEENQAKKTYITKSKRSQNTNNNIFFNSAIANQLFLDIYLKLIWQTIPKISLIKQNILKQELNIIIFIRRLLRWVQGFIWIWGIGLILLFYPQTRALSFLLIEGPIEILIIWVFVSLADKISDFVIQFYLHKWAENAQLANPNSERYALRVPTYSAALTNMTSIVFWIIGIAATAEILGIATQVLASAGVIAAVGAYFSQNLIKDVINGVLILCNDRYAVGDVVTIGNEGGFVEKMNLYMTELRSPDGELITIPHGFISNVKNLTKNWSRVNFTIEIAYNANVKKAMEIIQEVATKMQNEAEWRENFIEPATVLGVEQVSHSGILIRVWIKTPPLQQWAVGREFRLRVKEALDRQGIGIGVPQRSLAFQNYPVNGNGNYDDQTKEKLLKFFPSEN